MKTTNSLAILGEGCSIASNVQFICESECDASCISIGMNTIIRSGAIIYCGASIGSDVTIDHRVIIRSRTVIGDFCRVLNNTEIGADVKIGCDVRVGGFVCNRVTIGDHTATFGNLIHRYDLSKVSTDEPSPRIGSRVLIAMGATVIGGVSVPDGKIVKVGEIIC